MSKLALVFALMVQLLAPGPGTAAWPVAHPDHYAGRPGETLLVAAPGVLENDELPIGVSLVASVAPEHGRLVLDGLDGSFSYSPDPGFAGPDSFTYRLIWEGGSSTAVVALTITDEFIALDDQYTAYQNIPLEQPAPGVLQNDAPVDPRRTAVALTLPLHGSLELQPDGGFKYSPQPDYLGTDTFTYVFFTGSAGASNPATVTLDVAERPSARFKMGELVVNEYVGGITVGLILTTPHPGGTVALSFAPQTANCYRANPDLDCSAQTQAIAPNQPVVEFTVAIFDDPTPEMELEEVILGFNITGDEPDFLEVEPSSLHLYLFDNDNHRPVALPDAFTARAGRSLYVGGPGLLANDYDPDAGLIRLTSLAETGPGHGTLEVNTDGSLSYTPETGFAGVDHFTYTACDGFASSLPAEVWITVEPLKLHLPILLQPGSGR